jgi:transcriptional regulator with XRE-family HTH domain
VEITTKDIVQRLGVRIKELRRKAGYSQESFADSVGLHRTAMGHLETGRHDHRLSTLIRVARGLHISLAELVEGIDGPQNKRHKSH